MRSRLFLLAQCLPILLCWHTVVVISLITLLLSGRVAQTRQADDVALQRAFNLSRAAAATTTVAPAKKRGQGGRLPKGATDISATATPTRESSKREVLHEADQAPLALGYTLIQETPQPGQRMLLKRIQTAAPMFRLGDKVRLLIETNADGYLYVFNTVNGQDPELLFPNPRLEQGENRVQAHVPREIPSREEPLPADRWFEFQPPAGTEQLYLVLSRSPLAQLPHGAALLQQCQGQKNCVIKPALSVWRQLVATAQAPTQTALTTAGPAQLVSGEDAAVTRRLRLPATAPQPAVLQQNQSATAAQLVVIVNLVSR